MESIGAPVLFGRFCHVRFCIGGYRLDIADAGASIGSVCAGNPSRSWGIETVLPAPTFPLRPLATILARSRKHQRDVIRLFLIADPVIDRSGHSLSDFQQGKVAILADQVDESCFPEFAEIIFGLGDAVTVSEKDVARFELDRSLVKRKIVEESHNHAALIETADRTVLAHNDGRQMAAVAVRDPARSTIIKSQEQCRVLLLWRAGIELMI